MCPYPPRRGRGECPKKCSRIFMYGNGLAVFGMFWGGLGYFEAVGFQKRNLAHYSTVMVWWCLGCFGVVWGVLGRFGVFRGRRFPKKET